VKIGLLSDTHDHTGNLVRALKIFRDQEVKTLIHCGDMTSPRLADHLKGFDVVYLTGNMDPDPGGMGRKLKNLNPKNIAKLTYTGSYDGVPVAATHGHLIEELDRLIQSQRYRYVFHGHTHRRRDEAIGDTRVINPGALGGVRYEFRSVCILDLQLGEVSVVKVAE